MSLKLPVAAKVVDMRAQAVRHAEAQKCVVVTEAVSCLRLIDSCIPQLKAQGPSRVKKKKKKICVVKFAARKWKKIGFPGLDRLHPRW